MVFWRRANGNGSLLALMKGRLCAESGETRTIRAVKFELR